ncbi:MAG TPA: hypothetical protein VHP12_02200, partial [Chitinophagaceae bacterium]|nr:hypothetical protein [Chitinophagaceae bacterium]
MIKKIIISFFLFLFCFQLNAQTLGGSSVFNFLNQSHSSQLSALGGINISNISNDVSLAFNNPALLRDNMHQHFDASFNNFLAGIKNYSLTSAFHAN